MARDHIVPKMLLRRFADANDQLTATPRFGGEGTRIKMTVTRACREVGFYDLDIDPAFASLAQRNQVERSLADFEGRASQLFDRFTSGTFELSDQDRFDLMLFVSFQAVRGWAFRSELSEIGTLMAREELEVRLTDERVGEHLRERGEPHDDAAISAWRELVLTSNWKLRPSGSEAVKHMTLLALNTLHPSLYFGRRVCVHRFSEPLLLISDEPLVMWARADRDLDQVPLAIGTADALYMPIDRRHALALRRGGDEGIVDSRAGRAQRINWLVAAAAHRWVFQHPDDPPCDVSDLLRREPWTVETLGVRVDDESVRVQKRLIRRSG